MFDFVYTKHKTPLNIFAKLVFILMIVVLQSCSATKYVLKDNESLLVANKILMHSDIKNFDDKNKIQTDLARQVVYNQQPNKKFMNLFRLKLGLYASSYRKGLKNKEHSILTNDSNKKKKKNKAFFEDYAGEPPVIFDSSAIESSKSRMKNYLFYKGYFHNNIETAYTTKKKKTIVTYHIDTDTAFKYKHIIKQAEDSILRKYINETNKDSYLKEGDIFDIDNIKKERERIATYIQNKGYYTFSPDFIVLRVDSSTAGKHLVDAYLVVKNEVDSSLHKKYVYLDVNVNVNHDINSKYKKATVLERRLDTICNVNYNVAKNSINPKILSRSLRIKPEDIYSVDEQLATRSNLYGLGVFKFINVKHEPFSFSPEEMGLITSIECTMSKKHSFSNELELNTNAQSTLGFSLSGSYINKNVFNSAAKLYVSLRSGLDFQFQKSFQNGNHLSAINNVNVLGEVRISLARIFPSFKKKQCTSYTKYKPQTNISFNYNYQRRLALYTLNTISINYGYEWYNDKFRHIFSPLSLTYVKPSNLTSNFNDRLNNNPFLKKSFDNQFILGQDYTFFYTNQNINVGKYKNFFSFRANFNIGGNILYAFASLNKNKSKPYSLSNIPFAQFTRIELEPKYFFNFKKKQSLGFRALIGIGIPYGNSATDKATVMPYIKQFSAGGPMSLRAWPFRQIGPGGYKFRNTNTNIAQLDQTGDIRLELNTEYRFNIYKLFKGAIFSDAGNVWMFKKDTARTNAEFNFKRFGKEIAWCVGAGLRLDLSFFVIRFDVAVPLYDPSYTDGSKWISDIVTYRNKYFNEKYAENPNMSHKDVKKYYRRTEIGRMVGYNIAIGYPF